MKKLANIILALGHVFYYIGCAAVVLTVGWLAYDVTANLVQNKEKGVAALIIVGVACVMQWAYDWAEGVADKSK